MFQRTCLGHLKAKDGTNVGANIMRSSANGNRIRLDELIRELEATRRKAKKLREKINFLRQAVINLGGNPETWKPNNIKRNKSFYRRWKGGMQFAEIAREHDLSTTTISNVCNRIEKILATKRGNYKAYKSLARHK
jgi:hypothetical protein